MKQKIYSTFQWLLIKDKLNSMNIPNLYTQSRNVNLQDTSSLFTELIHTEKQETKVNLIARAKITIDTHTYIYVFEYEDGTALTLTCLNGDYPIAELNYICLTTLKRKLPFFIEIDEVELSLDEIKEEMKVIIFDNQQSLEGI